MMMLLWIAMLATTLLGEQNLLLLFIGGAMVGELVGLRWQPIGGGNSVGNLGMAGGLLALVIMRGTNLPIHLLAAGGGALGFVLLFQWNIHGAALLTGIALGLLLLRETKTSTTPARAVEGTRGRLTIIGRRGPRFTALAFRYWRQFGPIPSGSFVAGCHDSCGGKQGFPDRSRQSCELRSLYDPDE